MTHEINDAAASREARIAYHLAPTDVWEHQKIAGSYVPEAFETDGFIHATHGLEKLKWVANEFYTTDERAHTVLVIDTSALASPLRYDDDEQLFPHIYGPLNVEAVVDELPVHRGDNGAFERFGNGS